jgi:hypothetical protein
VIPAGRPDPQCWCRLAILPDLRWKEPVHARPLDTNPDNVFSGSGKKPDPDPSGHDNDHAEEVMLRDDRGRLRPPAYVLIALVIALAAILLLIVAVLFAPD